MEKSAPKYVRKSHEESLKMLLGLLKKDEQWSLDLLAAKMGVGRRSVFNYLNQLEERGYRIDRNNGYPRLADLTLPPQQRTMCNFAETDRVQLMGIFDRLALNRKLSKKQRESLLREMKELLTPYFRHLEGGKSQCVAALNTALNRRVQVVLHKYRSGSGTVEDRLVEPVAWSPDGRQISAFDVRRQSMRTFVPGRMVRVEVTATPWQHALQHKAPQYDIFWMSGEPFEVVLRLNNRALNLLHEEYHRSRDLPVVDVRAEDRDHPYQLTLECRDPYGVGRFVRGLQDNIVIVSGLEL